MTAPKPMLKVEVKRREDIALADIAATARYHADRLPTTSKWSRAFSGLADRLDPAEDTEA
jgi:hypothetical protein